MCDMERDMESYTREGEQVDKLRQGRAIIQKSDGFKFGTDAVLLADFAKVKKGESHCDLCTGGGIVPILMHKEGRRTSCVEISAEYADMARRSAAMNGMDIEVIEGDIKEIKDLLAPSSFEVVTVNPPYFKEGGGLLGGDRHIDGSRHEIFCNITDVVSAASHLLIPSGRLYMVHRPDRLADVICAMREAKIEPKRLRMVQGTDKKAPTLFLIEGRVGGLCGMVCEPTLVVMREGEETEEIKEIYKGRK